MVGVHLEDRSHLTPRSLRSVVYVGAPIGHNMSSAGAHLSREHMQASATATANYCKLFRDAVATLDDDDPNKIAKCSG